MTIINDLKRLGHGNKDSRIPSVRIRTIAIQKIMIQGKLSWVDAIDVILREWVNLENQIKNGVLEPRNIKIVIAGVELILQGWAHDVHIKATNTPEQFIVDRKHALDIYMTDIFEKSFLDT